jgi:hypothetical protein
VSSGTTTSRIRDWGVEQRADPVGVFLPLRTRNWLNYRGHPMARARERKTTRSLIWAAVARTCRDFTLPATVVLTRYSVAEMDSDGLQSALKSVRDGVADAFKEDDKDPRFNWRYEQAKAPRGCHGVRVRITD